MGDYVLLETAKHLCLISSSDDTIARIGEDRFAIFVRLRKNSTINTDNLIRTKAEALNNTIRKNYSIENNNIVLSCHVGVAILTPEIKDYDSLFEKASVNNKW